MIGRRNREPAGPLDYLRRWPLRLWVLLVGIFLYAPLVTLMLFSFNESKRNIVWTGFTFDWYFKAFRNASLFEAFTNSLTIAAVATAISVVLGALVAVACWRFRFPFKAGFEGTLALPIVVPEICMGVALLLFFNETGMMTAVVAMPWPLNLSNIIIAHVAFCFPFVAIVVRSRLVGFNRQLGGRGRRAQIEIKADFVVGQGRSGRLD